MSFSINIAKAEVASYNMTNINQIIIQYALDWVDNTDTITNLVVTGYNWEITISLTEGQNLPTYEELANLVFEDCQTRFGGKPDTVVVNGQSFTPPI